MQVDIHTWLKEIDCTRKDSLRSINNLMNGRGDRSLPLWKNKQIIILISERKAIKWNTEVQIHHEAWLILFKISSTKQWVHDKYYSNSTLRSKVIVLWSMIFRFRFWFSFPSLVLMCWILWLVSFSVESEEWDKLSKSSRRRRCCFSFSSVLTLRSAVKFLKEKE